MIKKADIVLGVLLVLLCLSSLFLLQLADGSGTLVTVTVEGSLYGTYDLSENQRIEIDRSHTSGSVSADSVATRHNVVEVRDGAVLMVEAGCSNQVCVRQGSIRRINQTIVCLPNKVVISISGPSGGMDAVSY